MSNIHCVYVALIWSSIQCVTQLDAAQGYVALNNLKNASLISCKQQKLLTAAQMNAENCCPTAFDHLVDCKASYKQCYCFGKLKKHTFLSHLYRLPCCSSFAKV